MNNTINNVNSVSFNARYLNIVRPERIPEEIRNAIFKSDAVDEFITAGKPKTILGKFIDLFRKDEPLNVKYIVSKIKIDETQNRISLLERLKDPYQKVESIIFEYNQRNGVIRTCELSTEQSGTKRSFGSIPKRNENYAYKPPIETADDKMVRQIEKLKDLDSLLK